ncbi:Mitotic-spindle organizing protein 1 [Erysiphe necator]|nr:Mitotic-spindle organizing protein 1 [Erysiphe necator]
MASESEVKQSKEANKVQARQVINIFHEISTLLNAGLDQQTLSICISLIENGVNPEALASVIRELRKDNKDIEKNTDINKLTKPS